MNVQEHSWPSPSLGHAMALRSYGHAGRPLVAFPSQNGRYYDFEGFGMVEACRGLIEAGRLRIFAVDGIDAESWTNRAFSPGERSRRHEDYDRYLLAELAPFVRGESGRDAFWVTGASMGAFHAASFFFRHPDVADGLIALSGLYQLRDFVGEFVDDAVYFSSPLLFLPNLEETRYLEQYRRSSIVFCVGQGAWEGPMIEDARAIERILAAKGIPAIVDYWGHDVDHDWPWWRRMLPYYLERLGV